MKKAKKMKPIRPKVLEATKHSRVFLLPPEGSTVERTDSLKSGAVLARQIIELAVLGGRDDIAMRALELAQDMER